MAGGHQRSHSEDQLLTTLESQVQTPHPGKEIYMHATQVVAGYFRLLGSYRPEPGGVKVLTHPA